MGQILAFRYCEFSSVKPNQVEALTLCFEFQLGALFSARPRKNSRDRALDRAQVRKMPRVRSKHTLSMIENVFVVETIEKYLAWVEHGQTHNLWFRQHKFILLWSSTAQHIFKLITVEKIVCLG